MKQNKILILTIFFIMISFLFIPNTMALDYNSICSDNGIKGAMKVLGIVIQIIRWIVPVILIVLGMVDFGKAAISSDDSALSKAASTLIRRFIAGLVVFFVPTIVMAALNAIEVTRGIEAEDNSQFGACTKCLFDAFGSCEITDDSSGDTTSSETDDTTDDSPSDRDHGHSSGNF